MKRATNIFRNWEIPYFFMRWSSTKCILYIERESSAWRWFLTNLSCFQHAKRSCIFCYCKTIQISSMSIQLYISSIMGETYVCGTCPNAKISNLLSRYPVENSNFVLSLCGHAEPMHQNSSSWSGPSREEMFGWGWKGCQSKVPPKRPYSSPPLYFQYAQISQWFSTVIPMCHPSNPI